VWFVNNSISKMGKSGATATFLSQLQDGRIVVTAKIPGNVHPIVA
jgi:hypothetical protein